MPKKIYARYIFYRGFQTLWKGDPAEAGAKFWSLAICTDEFNATEGLFQVYALEGTGRGVIDGKFARIDENPRVVFDKDFSSLDAASKQFHTLTQAAQQDGFELMSVMDMLEFESKLQK